MKNRETRLITHSFYILTRAALTVGLVSLSMPSAQAETNGGYVRDANGKLVPRNSLSQSKTPMGSQQKQAPSGYRYDASGTLVPSFSNESSARNPNSNNLQTLPQEHQTQAKPPPGYQFDGNGKIVPILKNQPSPSSEIRYESRPNNANFYPTRTSQQPNLTNDSRPAPSNTSTTTNVHTWKPINEQEITPKQTQPPQVESQSLQMTPSGSAPAAAVPKEVKPQAFTAPTAPAEPAAPTNGNGQRVWTSTFVENAFGEMQEKKPGEINKQTGGWSAHFIKGGLWVTPRHNERDGKNRETIVKESKKLIPEEIKLDPSSDSAQNSPFRKYRFKENGLFEIRTFANKSQSFPTKTDMYFILPASPKEMDLNESGNQFQIRAFGLNFETLTIKTGQSQQLKSSQCTISYDESPGWPNSSKSIGIKQCRGKMVLHLERPPSCTSKGAMLNLDPMCPMEKVNVAINFPGESNSCSVSGIQLFDLVKSFARDEPHYEIKSESEISKIISTSPNCSGLYTKFTGAPHASSLKTKGAINNTGGDEYTTGKTGGR